MMKTIVLAGFFSLAAIGARAESPETTADLRCFVAASASVAEVKDPALAAALKSAAIYYLGRLDGRAPGLDLKTRFIEEAGKMSKDDVAAEDDKCGKILVDRGTAVEKMGQDIKKQ